jgi:hypothetical protein
MTDLRSVAGPAGKVAIAGPGYVGLPEVSDERCTAIETADLRVLVELGRHCANEH